MFLSTSSILPNLLNSTCWSYHNCKINLDTFWTHWIQYSITQLCCISKKVTIRGHFKLRNICWIIYLYTSGSSGFSCQNTNHDVRCCGWVSSLPTSSTLWYSSLNTRFAWLPSSFVDFSKQKWQHNENIYKKNGQIINKITNQKTKMQQNWAVCQETLFSEKWSR